MRNQLRAAAGCCDEGRPLNYTKLNSDRDRSRQNTSELQPTLQNVKKKKLHLFSIRLQLLGSVAHSMQCMWGTLWYFVHKQNKQNYWGHDDIRVPWHIACSGLCGRPHWTQEEEICACCMQITLKSSIQIRYCVVEVRLFMRQKRSNRWTYIQVFADFHTKKKITNHFAIWAFVNSFVAIWAIIIWIKSHIGFLQGLYIDICVILFEMTLRLPSIKFVGPSRINFNI